MGIRKFNKEGPSAAQFGDILYNFVWMLILKIMVYLVGKQLYSFIMKILRRHQAVKVEAETKVETCDNNSSSKPDSAQCESMNLGKKQNLTEQDVYNRKRAEIHLRKFQERLAKQK